MLERFAEENYLNIRGDNLKGLFDLSSSGTATNVQEIGRASSMQLNDIHGGHSQTSTVHKAANVSCKNSGCKEHLALAKLISSVLAPWTTGAFQISSLPKNNKKGLFQFSLIVFEIKKKKISPFNQPNAKLFPIKCKKKKKKNNNELMTYFTKWQVNSVITCYKQLDEGLRNSMDSPRTPRFSHVFPRLEEFPAFHVLQTSKNPYVTYRPKRCS